jgi:hypothetical protein
MNNSNTNNSAGSSAPATAAPAAPNPAPNGAATPTPNTAAPAAPNTAPTAAQLIQGFAPLQWLKNKRISYLTLPLLFMATVTEFVILATGWKYQQMVCLPRGMGVTFFGIGPIGATILAVELLKLPLAIWTASRHGLQKIGMLIVGLPLICLLTFQLVKDMAVYEMGIAMAPATELLKQATDEDVKIAQLNGELALIDQKKAIRDSKLAELAGRKAKTEADLEESLKRNQDLREDAISLTDYQKKELSDVDSREGNIIKQCDADATDLTKSLNDLRARRETELSRATSWNAEEVRLDNAYKEKMAKYDNAKAEYVKDKSEYDKANFVKRQFLKEPIDPGVPPVREANTILKPTLLAEIDDQIKSKEAELLTVNNRRRDEVAQVEEDARKLREQFGTRSSTKREESDRKRDELLTAQSSLSTQASAEEKQINAEYEATAQKADGIRSQLEESTKRAESLYEAREIAIENTQVHRIATTVEIIRGLLMGQRPVTIKNTAKERGDLYTDQISMVRIWVYPVLAFIVAFLPTLLVEIGFSTVFEPEEQRPKHRLGFLGSRLHALYVRAGRQKILRAERLANAASSQIASRDRALAAAQSAAQKALEEKEKELQEAQAVIATANAERDALLARQKESHAARVQRLEESHEAQLKTREEAHETQLKTREEEWVSKLAGMADSLNRMVIEKDALRDLQKSEIERQIQMRQNAWSDRLSQMRQELDDQRNASEAERTAMMQAHHKKLMEVSEETKAQVVQARRAAADAELAAMEASAKLTHELKEAIHSRDSAETQLQQQEDTLSLKLAQVKEEAARELEKAIRQEKHRQERQQLEFGKNLRQREEDFEHKLKQQEQEATLAFDARLAEEQTRMEQNARRREAELTRQLEARAMEVDNRWKQEVQQREEAAQVRLKQREQQLQAQAEVRITEIKTQSEQEMRRQETEAERQIETQAREADVRLKQELQQKELAFQTRLKQREQELALKASTREAELQEQLAADVRAREEELAHQAEARVQALENRLAEEAKHKDEEFQAKLRQQDQQWQVKMDAARTELQAQAKEALRKREAEANANVRTLETQLRKEMQQKDEAAQIRLKQREQELETQFTAQAEARQAAAQALWETETDKKIRLAVEPIKAQLARAEEERDEAMQAYSEGARHVQNLEKKLTEASTFLNGWKNGKHLVTGLNE